MAKVKWVSPNELIDAASEMMLDGRKPESHEDWSIVVQFAAVNVDREVAESVCRLLVKMYAMPLSDAEVRRLVAWQLERDEREEAQAPYEAGRPPGTSGSWGEA